MSVESCAWLCNLCFCLSFYPINCKNILPCCPLVARRWHAALCDEGLARLPNGLSRNVFRHVLRCEMRRIADPSGRRHGIAPVLLCFIAVHGLVAYHRSAAAYGGRLSCNANGGMVSPGSSFVLVFSCFQWKAIAWLIHIVVGQLLAIPLADSHSTSLPSASRAFKMEYFASGFIFSASASISLMSARLEAFSYGHVLSCFSYCLISASA